MDETPFSDSKRLLSQGDEPRNQQPVRGSGPLLAIETSQRNASVALLAPTNGPTESMEIGRVVEERLAEDQPTTRTLAPAIAGLLSQFSVVASELSCVVVDCGPGSFTGLRVGIAFAKTLSFVAQVPIVGLRSLELIAYMAVQSDRSRLAGSKILSVVDAQRGQYYAAGYVEGVEVIAPQIADEKWTIDKAGEGWILAGPAVEKICQRNSALDTVEGRGHVALPPNAQALAQFAWTRRGQPTDDVYGLLPLYLRPSAAEEKAASA